MKARPVIPGKTYLLTRRTSDRRFFLRPGEDINNLVQYELARAAKMYGVQVHGFVVMSNHIHLLVTDVLGLLPYFMHCFCLQVSKGGSSIIGRWGGFWASGRYSRVETLDAASMLEKLAYVIGNPSAAGLVRRAARWPGLTSVKMKFEETIVVHRPVLKFYIKSAKPLEVEFKIVPPPGLDAGVCVVKVAAAVRQIEKDAAARLKADKRKFVGERRVQSQDPYDCATAWEKRRGLDPTFSSRDNHKRAEAAQRSKDWAFAYLEALFRFNAGIRDVVFPTGTWQMFQFHGCNADNLPIALAA